MWILELCYYCSFEYYLETKVIYDHQKTLLNKCQYRILLQNLELAHYAPRNALDFSMVVIFRFLHHQVALLPLLDLHRNCHYYFLMWFTLCDPC